MKPEEAIKPAPTWNEGCWADRLDMCRSVLYVHGFLTDSQSDQVNKKIEKWAAKGGVTRVSHQSSRVLDLLGTLERHPDNGNASRDGN